MLSRLFYFRPKLVSMIKPPLLRKGDKIGLVAPSRMITQDQIEFSYDIFKKWGLKVVKGDNLLTQNGYFAGTDEQRHSDIQSFVNDDDIKAIFCARGGYGMTRIIDYVDISPLKNQPKWIIGFSDITALHIKLELNDIPSIHGLMPVQYGDNGMDKSLASLYDLLFHGTCEVHAEPHDLNILGGSSSTLVGGNLSLVAESLGTHTEIDTKGKILFLEEVDEYLYKIDRMFNQLNRANKLSELAGLVIGDFSDMKDTQIPFGVDVYKLIDQHVKQYDFPVAFNFPIGHEQLNMAVPLGLPVRFNVDESGGKLKII